MRIQLTLVAIGLALGILWLVTGCNVQNPNVQDIIPAEVDAIHWFLSPSGDKLLYDSNTMATRNQAFVRFLATGQDVSIADCPQFSWLDDESIYCYDYQEPQDIPIAVISNIAASTSTFTRVSIESGSADQVQLNSLLEQAKSGYRLHPFAGADSLLLNIEPQKNTELYYHISGINDLDTILKKYQFTTVFLPVSFVDAKKKIYSPNGKYYYRLRDSLGIYEAESDRLLIGLTQDAFGWMGI